MSQMGHGTLNRGKGGHYALVRHAEVRSLHLAVSIAVKC